MALSLTAANAVIMLSITGLFPVPQQLQGFAADDIFDTEDVDPAEIVMGVDGKLSGGFVFVAVKQSYMLQADSASNELFEQWQKAQRAARDLYYAQGSVILPSLSKAYTMTRGILSAYSPAPNAKKLLQPRKFGITWESVSPAVI